ncbi:uncharacterized protein LOC131061102 [Cryptomeria japonica]|uniref:uncharacterized protein LOC131061102 n=1 Tax=Cryptomeria japonica TaxID=3369 RepID=UPI0027DA92ED|nr:uncharacterized protein LOC131061102 [Cryptomeria japonica]
MRHRSQQTASVFLRTNLENSIPTTLQALREQLQSTPFDQLPNQLMRFAASLQGTRAYWKRSRKDLTTMIHQLGTPTLFFTLSAADTKWPELHKLFPPNLSPEFQSMKKQFIQNIVHNPHVTALFLHFRLTIFREEIIDKLFKAKDHWYMYEWQHRGSAHIHGFLWLPNAPDMDKIDWSNHEAVQSAKSFFDRYVTAWNPRNQIGQSNRLHTASLFDPCMANTNQILSTDPLSDYEELVNVVQRHTKCSAHTCLKKKGSTLHCRYKAPWPEQDFSTLIVDTANNPSYEPARNDSRLNIHNPNMLAIWRANIDCQPICSKMAVIQYISKYAAKTEQKSVGYVDILKKIVATTNTQDTILLTYQKFMMGIVADRDISAQETCHMLQKLPLISCSQHFVSLNVSRKALHRIAEQNDNAELSKSYISAYMERPIELESISLIQSA